MDRALLLSTSLPRLSACTSTRLRHGAAASLFATFLTVTGASFAQPVAPQSAAAGAGEAHATAQQAAQSADDPVIARVKGVELRESDVRLADEGIGKDIPPLEGAQRREYLIAFLSDMVRLAKAAEAQNAGDQTEIRRRMEFTRNKTLMDEILETTGRNAVTDETLHKAYAEYVGRNPPEPELHLRMMLFRFPSVDDHVAVDAAEAKAKEAIKRIAAGEDFGKVAAQVSDTPDAKIDAGDLGFLKRAAMGKEYADVAFKLAKNEVSAPIKTSFGWHVIRVEGERTSTVSSFDEMRPTLAGYLTRRAQVQLLNEVRQAAPIERLDTAAAVEKPGGAVK